VAGVRRTMVGGLSSDSPNVLAPRSASKSLRPPGLPSDATPTILNHTATQRGDSRKEQPVGK